MKTSDPAANFFAWAGALALVAGGVALPAAGVPAGAALLLAAPIWVWACLRRSWRRAELARAPFPPAWRDVLETRVPFYHRLNPERRADFERDVAVFIGEHSFSGVDGVDATDELKLLAAASAVMLLFGRPDLDYPHIAEVLFYPDRFDEDMRTDGAGRDIAGLAHPFGAVVLSVPELQKSFSSENDGYHSGIHEFAHLLDFSQGRADGVPGEVDPRRVRAWYEATREGLRRARCGRSVLRGYAATNEAEYFAVAVEAFFERPEDLKRGEPALYDLLDDYFGPAKSA